MAKQNCPELKKGSIEATLARLKGPKRDNAAQELVRAAEAINPELLTSPISPSSLSKALIAMDPVAN